MKKHNEETYLEIEKVIREFRVQALYKETASHLHIPIVLDDDIKIYLGVHQQTELLSFELEFLGSIIFSLMLSLLLLINMFFIRRKS